MFTEVVSDNLESTQDDSILPASETVAKERVSINVPAQMWERFTDTYSAQELGSASEKSIASVRTFTFGGNLYTCSSVSYMGSRESSSLRAHKLFPKNSFSGNYFRVPSFKRIEGSRGFSAYHHMVVKSSGKEFVLVEEVDFICGLPTCEAMSLAEAISHTEQVSKYGWRAHYFKAIHPKWRVLSGHPVACYHNEETNKSIFALLWKCDGEVRELMLNESVFFDECLTSVRQGFDNIKSSSVSAQKVLPPTLTQASLF